MTKRALIVVVLVLVLAVAGAVGATWYVVGSGNDEGWSTRDEEKALDYLQDPSSQLTDDQAACALEVYEEYFSTHAAWSNAGDSPTLQKANATAVRRCSIP